MTEKITREEADRRIEEFKDWSTKLWGEAVAAAQAILASRGIESTKIGFDAYAANGEYTAFTVEWFDYLDSDGQWHRIEWGDDEDKLWDRLEDKLTEFGTGLPPGDEGRIDNPGDLANADLEMFMFADFDGDGYFQYDDKGMKSIIENTWF